MYNVLESFFRGVVRNEKSHLDTLFGGWAEYVRRLAMTSQQVT